MYDLLKQIIKNILFAIRSSVVTQIFYHSQLVLKMRLFKCKKQVLFFNIHETALNNYF